MQAMPMDHKCPWAFVVTAHEYDHHGHVVMNHDQSVEVWEGGSISCKDMAEFFVV